MSILKRLLIPAVVLASIVSPSLAADEDPVSTVEGFLDALSRADLDALLTHVADDATVFAPLSSSPQRIEGRHSIAALFEKFFNGVRENADGPVRMKIVHRDLEVQSLGDSAIVTFHLGDLPDESPSEAYSFSRRTFVLHIVNGEWKIVHFHGSNVTIPEQTVESK